MSSQTSALVLFSGGQDSAICLAWALDNYDSVHTIGFRYGQRHDVEMECRDTVRDKIGDLDFSGNLAADTVLDLPALGQISETALTRQQEIAFDDDGMPNTFVPGRNLIFLNFAAALAYRLGTASLVAGMCEADFSGYPDCRKETLDATLHSISLGMDKPFTLHTPLMHLSKAESWHLAHTMGGDDLVDIVNVYSHTCYLGQRGERHIWGHGCGQCPACHLRAKGWAEYAGA